MGILKRKNFWEEDGFFKPLVKLDMHCFKNLERLDAIEATHLCYNLYGTFANHTSYLIGLDGNNKLAFRDKCTTETLNEQINREDSIRHSLSSIKITFENTLKGDYEKYTFFLQDSIRVICTKYGIIVYEYDSKEYTISLMTLASWTKEGLQCLKGYLSGTLNITVSFTKNYRLVYEKGGQYWTKQMPIKSISLDVKKNYSETLDYDRILNASKGEETSFILLHGKPGTGKTYLIRKLMMDLQDADKEILYIDPSVFQSFSKAGFFDFLLSHKNSTLIMEDCELALLTREQAINPIMNNLLNLTDGIVGESLGIHFICTFNTNLKNIDKALLRKGRLTYIHEFKELSLEQTRKHIPEATKPMTIGDIYNYQINNGYNESYNKIGFGG